ncbi:MAG: DUF72 domain-containing protein [bacterium]
MATYWIGTSGYSYKQWKGNFYPDTLPDADMLRYYGERFAAVEINYTFYRQASVRQLQGWAKDVPAHFTFALKAPRRITHDLRLRDAADFAVDFCDTARALKEKLGALLFQLPPFLKRDTARLEDFLHQMPEGFRVAFEFRNQTWFADDVYETLRRFGVALCIVETPERSVPFERTAEFGYFRLRQPEYSDAELAECAARIQAAATEWRDVFIYFKHEQDGQGPILATRLRALLEGADKPVAASV